ncbi:MAG: S-adenosylmethionine decarboxylase [Candidatus Pacearchaeota archaeon]|nr:S-adenosylmethionine decarboxylase [Candidatus Pacearchaeota archaeon]
MKKENYRSPPIGQEISCTFKINDKKLLNNNGGKLKKILEEALLADKFHILGWTEHFFLPQGYSCVALLEESHADFHSYPEHNSLFFNMYSCRGENDVRNTIEYIENKLNYPEILFYSQNKIPVTKKAAKKLKNN